MAVTVNSRSPISNGNRRGDVYDIAAGWADADVITTRLNRVREVEVQITDEDVAAADAVSALTSKQDTTLAKNQIKLQLIGTARRLQLTVKGY